MVNISKDEKDKAADDEPSSHPTKDSEDRDKAAKKPEAFGNEWKSEDAGGDS